jgi:hypothetical protein
MAACPELSRDEEWKYAEQAMRWYGWGSPIGLGLFVVALTAAAAIVKLVFFAA